MSSCALLRPSRLLGLLPAHRVVLSLLVLSIAVGMLAPSATASAAAHLAGRTHIDSDVKSFHFFSPTEAAVLGNDGNLWLEHGPFGTVPPSRTLIVGGGAHSFDLFVTGFEAISDTEFLVLEDATLFTNELFLKGPNTSPEIDEDVKGFHWLSDSEILVLGNDGNLWLERGPFDHIPPARVHVDANVTNFQAFSDNEILALGTDGKLWLEHGPFGNVPPSRVQVDANVITNPVNGQFARPFQAFSDTQILVAGSDGKLWVDQAPFGHVPPPRTQIDGSVLNFQEIDGSTVVVLGQDEKLWLEHAPFGHVPPARQQIDANAIAFEALSTTLIGVKGDDNNLWLEQAPFG